MPDVAEIVRALRKLVLIQDVTVGFGDREARRDTILDAGSTYCIIPKALAEQLDLGRDDRLGTERVQGVSGWATMDRYILE